MEKRLVIVDISSFIFRAFYAIRPMNAPDGTPTNAINGVLSMLLKLIEKYEPSHLVLAQDSKEKTFRHDMYVEYKANRSEPPEDLIPQFELAYQLCESLGIHCFRQGGVEADDLMASLALLSWQQNHPVQMVTVDKDLNQMICDEPVYIHRVNFFKKQVFTKKSVIDSMGVSPKSCVDFMALVGDSVDNIPGVKGIGPKKAAALIQRFGSIESIYENIEELSVEKGWKNATQKLIENKEKAFLSKKLVTLKKDIDLSRQVTDIQRDLLWVAGDSYPFLSKLGLERYHSDLQPI